jgi:hypothetical protein
MRIESGIQSVWDHKVVKDMRESVPGRVTRAFFAITLIILAIIGIAKLILLLAVIAPPLIKGGLIVAMWAAIVFGGSLVLTGLYFLARKIVEAIHGCIAQAAEQRA